MAHPIGVAAPPRGAAAPQSERQRNQQRISQAMLQLQSAPSGREVADFMVANQVLVRVVPDAEFAARYPGSGAVYDAATRRISIPTRALGSARLATTLAHEGKHAMDFASRPHWVLQSLGLIGGTAKDGARALVIFRNPVSAWLDSLTARQHEDEVAAYALQARVAHELGRNESRWSIGQAPDGTPLSTDEIRARVATDDLYRMEPGRRLLFGAGLGLASTSMAAIGVQQLASRLRPGSFLAGNSWPIYALGGAMTAAWVAGDQVRARRLEAYAALS